MSLLSRAIFGICLNSNCKYPTISPIYIYSYVIKHGPCLVQRVFKSTTEDNGVNLEKYTTEKNDELKSLYVPFDQMIENRRREARRSVLIQVNSEKSCVELHEYCSRFGYVKGIHHYSLPTELHFAVVEFQNERDAKNILQVCCHLNKGKVIPVQSPLLWFRASKSKSTKSSSEESKPLPKMPLVTQNATTAPTELEVRNMLLSAETFSDQILILHNATRLNDVGTRLRFLTARQIELTFSGLFPGANALPFGSSVNGFGKFGCDLDLSFYFDKEDVKPEEDECRLVFHTKKSISNSRLEVQRHMELISDLCSKFLPGCSQVRRILQARVPIIKYKQDLMDIECDLSMTNKCAVYMSELLYIFGNMDYRVRPLVFAVRRWARDVGVTSPTPGLWISNFSLSLLVLFFMQNIKLLPSLNTLLVHAAPEDKRITSDGVNCTFLRDITKLAPMIPSSVVSDNLEQLLFQFFKFYSSFDFGARAVSLDNGVSILKPDHSPLYIVNPLEKGLNVSKNISTVETERFKTELRNAVWHMELSGNAKPSATEAWGLVSLLHSGYTSSTAKEPNVSNLPPPTVLGRMTQVQRLFYNLDKAAQADANVGAVQKVSSSHKRDQLQVQAHKSDQLQVQAHKSNQLQVKAHKSDQLQAQVLKSDLVPSQANKSDKVQSQALNSVQLLVQAHKKDQLHLQARLGQKRKPRRNKRHINEREG